MAQIFKNNTTGTLASELAAGATTCTLNAGHTFTDPGSDWYLATLVGVTGTTETSWEIVKVTNVATNTLTLERAQESTSDATWPAGTRIEARLTAGATESKANLGAAAYKAVGTGSGDVAAGNRGVTNGDSHDHSGGDGAQIAYSSLSGTPSLPLSIANGGTGSTTAAGACSALGVGTEDSPRFTHLSLDVATPSWASGIVGLALGGSGSLWSKTSETVLASNLIKTANGWVTIVDGTASVIVLENGIIKLWVTESGTAGTEPADWYVPLSANGNGIAIRGAITEYVYTISGTTPALSPTNGTIQPWTLSGASTPTVGTFDAGMSMLIMINDGSAYTIDWGTVNPTWVGGSAPTLDLTKYTCIKLWKVGTTIYGVLVGAA